MKMLLMNRKYFVFISVTLLITCGIQSTSYAQAGNPTITASTLQPLADTTLDGGIVTLTLSGGTYVHWAEFRRRDMVAVSGIAGVVVKKTFGVDRVSDTKVNVELEFNGTLATNGKLTFTVEPEALVDYKGPSLTSEIPVTVTAKLVVISTLSPLTETTLSGSVVTLTLNGGTYAGVTGLKDAVTVSGIDGITFDDRRGLERVSDTKVKVKLAFNGNIDTDTILTFTVGADAIARYGGPPVTAKVPVTANTETVVASSTSPLTEATLDGSIVTLMLSGRTYGHWADVKKSVTVSGISGVTVPRYVVERVNDTRVRGILKFDGTNFNTDTTLTFTVDAEAVANYDGPPAHR